MVNNDYMTGNRLCDYQGARNMCSNSLCDYRDAYNVVDLLEVQYIFKRHNALMRISPDINLITVK